MNTFSEFSISVDEHLKTWMNVLKGLYTAISESIEISALGWIDVTPIINYIEVSIKVSLRITAVGNIRQLMEQVYY